MITIAEWMWPGIPSHGKRCLDLRGVDLVGLRVVLPQVIQNGRFIEF